VDGLVQPGVRMGGGGSTADPHPGNFAYHTRAGQLVVYDLVVSKPPGFGRRYGAAVCCKAYRALQVGKCRKTGTGFSRVGAAPKTLCRSPGRCYLATESSNADPFCNRLLLLGFLSEFSCINKRQHLIPRG